MNVARRELWLAPLRGVTIRAFRTVFADAMREAGFTGAFAPFTAALSEFFALFRSHVFKPFTAFSSAFFEFFAL